MKAILDSTKITIVVTDDAGRQLYRLLMIGADPTLDSEARLAFAREQAAYVKNLLNADFGYTEATTTTPAP